ncbi:MAG: hypothetical protein HY431_01055 [Candidatus Levybacteria bacterium]|nr:hypothetical protein [Candidatus Levybacteria bacterium]
MREKDLFYLVLSSFILTVLWVGSNIYHAFATSTISDVLKVQIAPISPHFDPKVIQNLKQREKVTPIFSFSAQGGGVSPTPSPTPRVLTPSPTGGPTRTPTPTASASAGSLQENSGDTNAAAS